MPCLCCLVVNNVANRDKTGSTTSGSYGGINCQPSYLQTRTKLRQRNPQLACPFTEVNQTQMYCRVRHFSGLHYDLNSQQTSLTIRPTALLWRCMALIRRIFRRGRLRLLSPPSRSAESTNCSDTQRPCCMLSLHPPHVQPLGGWVWGRWSVHAQLCSSPLLQDLLAACATPAEVMAWMNAVSLLPFRDNRHKQIRPTMGHKIMFARGENGSRHSTTGIFRMGIWQILPSSDKTRWEKVKQNQES